MELNIEEQKLLADFRRLHPAGKKELMDYAVFLQKKGTCCCKGEEHKPAGQCTLHNEEPRPELAKEPIFTE